MPTKKSNQTAGGALSRPDIERLIEVIHEKGIEEFELEQGGMRVRIVASRGLGISAAALASLAATAPAAPAPVPSANAVTATSSTPKADASDEDARLKKITSPMVGTFYRAATPGAKPFAEIGDKVTPDSVLCIIEAMKLLNEIKAEAHGVIRKILVENGQPVEYGQTMFLIDPA